jgi:hypothetical protein
MDLPTGWTDDMSVQLISSISEDELVKRVMQAFRQEMPFAEVLTGIVTPCVIDEDDADLVLDRALGGIVRALTGGRQNCPDKRKDPVAWRTFMIVWETLPRKRWWSSDKVANGYWHDWNQRRLERIG